MDVSRSHGPAPRYAITDVEVTGAERVMVRALNRRGEVIGLAEKADRRAFCFRYSHGESRDLATRAFLYRSGVMHDLNRLIPASSGWLLASAEGINDAGQIAGSAIYHGKTRGFLLTPSRSPVATGTGFRRLALAEKSAHALGADAAD